MVTVRVVEIGRQHPRKKTKNCPCDSEGQVSNGARSPAVQPYSGVRRLLRESPGGIALRARLRVCPGSLNGRLVGCSVSTEFGKVRRFGAHRAPYEDLPGQTLSRLGLLGQFRGGRCLAGSAGAARRRSAARVWRQSLAFGYGRSDEAIDFGQRLRANADMRTLDRSVRRRHSWRWCPFRSGRRR